MQHAQKVNLALPRTVSKQFNAAKAADPNDYHTVIISYDRCGLAKGR